MATDEGVPVELTADWLIRQVESEDEEEGSETQTWELHDVVEEGNVERLAELLKINKKTDEDFDPEKMQEAEEEDDEDVDVDERDEDGLTPLHVALLNGQLECLGMLMEAGAETLLRCQGTPGLHIAISVGALPKFHHFSLQALKMILAHAPEANILDDTGRTGLHLCAELGLISHAEVLLQAGASLEVRDKTGQMPLHLATAHPALLRLLLDKGADASALSSILRTPLHAAANEGCTESVQILLSKSPELLALEDKWGLTALTLAQRSSHQSCVALLQGESSSSDSEGSAGSPLAIVAPPECHLHITCAEPVRGGPDLPPENDTRLSALTHPDRGILRSSIFGSDAVRWVEGIAPAAMADVLRIHDYAYIKRLQEACFKLQPALTAEPPTVTIGHLDADTAICSTSLKAALYGAGAAIRAVDEVVSGRARHAFCPVRPPGHHAGPSGVVGCENNPQGSHGFCLLNNVAIAAAYARCVYRGPGDRAGGPVNKVAIVDFDVHHGNGTQACVAGVLPTTHHLKFSTTLAEGTLKIPEWKPWLDNMDSDQIFLAGTQGYGGKVEGAPEEDSGCFYPGSGATCTTRGEFEVGEGEEAYAPHPCGKEPGLQPEGPWVINVGIPGPGACSDLWRRAWARRILPALEKFNPDLILVSAGFDAHRKDLVNCGYVGIEERDYTWVTNHLVQVANKCCKGRIVSVLEGGYRVQGGVISAFSRSVAAHVAALAHPTSQEWSNEVAEREMFVDRPEYYEEADIEAPKTDEQPSGAMPVDDKTLMTRKRRREPVDYTALNAKLDAEKEAAQSQNEKTSTA